MASNPDPMDRPGRPLPYYATAPEAPSGAATASLIVGIIALVCSIIPIIGLISWLLAPAAIIISFFGLSSPVNKGSAIAGLITGVIALIICILWVVVIGGAMASLGSARNF